VTRGNFADLPLALDCLSAPAQQQLRFIVSELKTALDDSIVYMPLFGKNIGNYNLAKCRGVTDKSDAILADAFGFTQVWDDIELLYAQTVKTGFDDSAADNDE
jgi:hypothetical protein